MTYLVLGLILFLIGSFHLFDQVKMIDSKIALFVQQVSNPKPVLSFFNEIWFIGRTSFALLTLGFLIIIDWKLGLISAVVFSIIIGIEYLLKTFYWRKRPHSSHRGIAMLQPVKPLDSSFPSGDSLRVWYLALILTTVAGDNLIFWVAAITLAALVTLGRLVMGVHYLTDALAGAGLGFVGAGITIWLWNILSIV